MKQKPTLSLPNGFIPGSGSWGESSHSRSPEGFFCLLREGSTLVSQVDQARTETISAKSANGRLAEGVSTTGSVSSTGARVGRVSVDRRFQYLSSWEPP